ncbi:hypothetical protein [Legionella sp. km772]|uniref:hypothetical protein n=1 Tax=Legionella sp. km772 TaxID=2498111 RepID=UPI000F8DC58B|nr:hypothetical protein [Legionella sp. km772]RUR13355.1 hypothetical protein ELY15_02600 [Legionella sp. km772]
MTVTSTDSLPPGFTGFKNTAPTLAGALARATQICNAEGVLLVPGSTWKPWLSSSEQAAAATLNASANYYRAGGAGWIGTGAGIIAGGSSIAFLGTSIDGTTTSTVYTGTNADGQSAGSGQYDNCADWTDLSGEAVGGKRDASDAGWTMNNLVGVCSESQPIYCVQQVKNG